jgi:hypothetical protein
MRMTTILAVVAAAAMVGGAATSASERPLASTPDGPAHLKVEVVEYWGELYPNPETGCIELPDEPGAAPRLWPYEPPSDGEPEEGFELHARPWPRCDDSEVSVVVTGGDVEVVEMPDGPLRGVEAERHVPSRCGQHAGHSGARPPPARRCPA